MARVLFIQDAACNNDLTVNLLFNDRTRRQVDIGAFIRQYPHLQYNKYLDERKFRQFKIEDGNIVWGKNWDLIFPIEQLTADELSNDCKQKQSIPPPTPFPLLAVGDIFFCNYCPKTFAYIRKKQYLCWREIGKSGQNGVICIGKSGQNGVILIGKIGQKVCNKQKMSII